MLISKTLTKLALLKSLLPTIGVARGQRGQVPPTFLEHIVILCFERRFSKQNSVIRLKSDILAPLKFLGWLRHWYPLNCKETLMKLFTCF